MKASDFQRIIDIQIQKVGDYDKAVFNDRIVLNALGLAGETGEVVDKIKKRVWSGRGIEDWGAFREDLGSELGDVLYHLAQLATEFGFNLEDLMKDCVAKSVERNGDY